MIYNLGNRQVQMKGRHYVAPGAMIIGSVEIGVDVSIWFNAVIRGDNDQINIGSGSNIQDGSVLHVDTGYPMSIGSNVTVGHKVMLHGCSIDDNSLIGMNAVVLNGAQIGKNCLIGAHALVTEGMVVPDNSLVLGAPAKIIKPVTEEMSANIASAAKHYQDKIALYSEKLSVQT